MNSDKIDRSKTILSDTHSGSSAPAAQPAVELSAKQAVELAMRMLAEARARQAEAQQKLLEKQQAEIAAARAEAERKRREQEDRQKEIERRHFERQRKQREEQEALARKAQAEQTEREHKLEEARLAAAAAEAEVQRLAQIAEETKAALADAERLEKEAQKAVKVNLFDTMELGISGHGGIDVLQKRLSSDSGEFTLKPPPTEHAKTAEPTTAVKTPYSCPFPDENSCNRVDDHFYQRTNRNFRLQWGDAESWLKRAPIEIVFKAIDVATGGFGNVPTGVTALKSAVTTALDALEQELQ